MNIFNRDVVLHVNACYISLHSTLDLYFSEFCGKVKEMADMTTDEQPKDSNIDYVMSSPSESNSQSEASGGEDGVKVHPGKGYLVYCIDISGSMSSATKLPELQGM